MVEVDLVLLVEARELAGPEPRHGGVVQRDRVRRERAQMVGDGARDGDDGRLATRVRRARPVLRGPFPRVTRSGPPVRRHGQGRLSEGSSASVAYVMPGPPAAPPRMVAAIAAKR